jgi:DNA-binding XRE family transcriptional regulator
MSNSFDDSDLREGARRLCARKEVDPYDLLTRRESAELIGISNATLAQAAAQKRGPKFRVAFGKARYVAFDVALWWFEQFKAPEQGSHALVVQRRRVEGKRIGRPPKALQAAA